MFRVARVVQAPLREAGLSHVHSISLPQYVPSFTRKNGNLGAEQIKAFKWWHVVISVYLLAPCLYVQEEIIPITAGLIQYYSGPTTVASVLYV